MELTAGVPEFRNHIEGQHLGASLVIIGSVVACSAAGAAVDVWRSKREVAKGATQRQGLRCWVLAMLISSYVLLFPGLFLKLFESRTDLVLFGMSQNMSLYDETVVSLVGRLWNDGMVAGSILVSVYAIVIPFLKIVLLVLGQHFQNGSPHMVHRARMCIRIVQAISKWACPDMFAYILLAYLMRGLDNPPTIRSGMSLDLGFTCFCVFCVGSTVSSLGIRLPELPARDVEISDKAGAMEPTFSDKSSAMEEASNEDLEQQTSEQPSLDSKQKQSGSRFHTISDVPNCMVIPLVVMLTLAFSVLLAIGLKRPSMSLVLDMDLLYSVRPDLADLKVIIDYLHLEESLKKEVSVWQCMIALFRWLCEGEVNAFISLVLYAFFAVLLPIVDVLITLCIAVLACHVRSAGAESSKVADLALKASSLSRKVRKLAMLDVSIMGCFVVVASLATMREQGVIVEARAGTAALVFAELCHHLAVLLARRALATVSVPVSRISTRATVSTELSSDSFDEVDESSDEKSIEEDLNASGLSVTAAAV